ncbi:KTSC domain-containing protein [Agarivorans sp. QJM3NY_29]
MTLEVEFHNGVYQYFDVPQYIYDELMSASSAGSYLHHNIKNTYSCTQI